MQLCSMLRASTISLSPVSTMENAMNETVLVLGANGRFGRVVVRAFADAGWSVIAQARRPLIDGSSARVRHTDAPVGETETVATTAAGTAVVVNAMNPLYTRWEAEALPLNTAAIAIARSLGATLMLPGNVYNYGSPIPAVIDDSTPQRPSNGKGKVRLAMEAAMGGEGLRSIVVRAGDFFGGPGTGSWMDQAIVRELAKGRITYPGPRRVEHAWAYLPDLARTFVLLAQARARLASHESLLFPGCTLSGDELVEAITGSARRLGLLAPDRAPVVTGMPWALVRVAGVFNPMLRELSRMSYLWREPHRLAGSRLQEVIGAIPRTPLNAALDATLAELKLPGPDHARAVALAAGASAGE
jgi:nucleoside-diphosphate-sugar epimerase